MSHEIEILEDGTASMFYAGETPWHGLGMSIEKEVTSEAALRFAQLDWQVVKNPIFLAGRKKVDDIPVIGTEAEDFRAVVRSTDRRILGVVRKTYEPIQNADAFAFLDALVGEGLAMFHAAGSLFEGRRIFITCKLPKSLKVGPDIIDKYLIAATGHDGSFALHCKFSPIRVICWNTCSAALQIDRHGKPRDTVAIRHTKNYKAKVEEARKMLKLTDIYYDLLQENLRSLRKSKMSLQSFQAFAKVLYPDTAINKETNEIVASAQTERKREILAWFFENGTGNKHKDVKHTKYAGYNAVTEFIDHGRDVKSTDDEAKRSIRMNSLLWGAGSNVKKKALALLSS